MLLDVHTYMCQPATLKTCLALDEDMGWPRHREASVLRKFLCRIALINSVLFGLCFALGGGVAVANAALLVEDLALKVDIRGGGYALETMIVKSDAYSGRLPIALIAHGSPRDRNIRSQFHARAMLPQARDLAHRGWLVVVFMRRGFGNSDGPLAEGFVCATPDFRQALATAAEDIAAVHKVIAARSDADHARVLGIGSSAGGGAMLAWAATRPEGLVGVVNIAGGTGALLPERHCDENGLVATIGAFGVQARAPTLWLYAQNDSFFPPDLVRRMHAAYRKAGGNAKLVTFGPVGKDGHLIASLYEGRVLWLPELDRFLRTHQLPTWDPRPFDAVSRALHPSQRAVVTTYLNAPTEKVLSISRDHSHAWFWSNTGDVVEAQRKSRHGCERAARQSCEIVAENFTRTVR